MATNLLAVRRRVRRHTTAVDAVLVYVGLRLVSVAVILLAQRDQPPVTGLSRTPYLGMITHWDGQWFGWIARSGYPHHLPHGPSGGIEMNQWAFYPGFPFLTRAVMQLTDTGFATADTLVDLVFGLVAAVAIGTLLETRIPRTGALAVVAVWAALPMAPSLQLAYSEALAMGLLSLALLWLMREQWGRATAAALLLGLARPILPPLAVVFAVAAWRRWRRRAIDPMRPAEQGRMLGGLALTLAGAAVWPLVAWWSTGVPGAYARTEAAWHRGSSTPFTGLANLHPLVRHGHPVWLHVMVVAAICVAVALTVAALRSPRLDPVLVTWCVAYLVFDLAVGNMHPNELRMLLPLFPLVAVAIGVAAARPAKRWRERAWLAITLGIVGQYAWVMMFVRYVPGVSRAP